MTSRHDAESRPPTTRCMCQCKQLLYLNSFSQSFLSHARRAFLAEACPPSLRPLLSSLFIFLYSHILNHSPILFTAPCPLPPPPPPLSFFSVTLSSSRLFTFIPLGSSHSSSPTSLIFSLWSYIYLFDIYIYRNPFMDVCDIHYLFAHTDNKHTHTRTHTHTHT